MKKLLPILALVAGLFTSKPVSAQRVLAYYPYYVTGEETSVQYDKLTDIVYAFLQLNGSGNLASGTYFNTSQFAQIRDLAITAGCNVHVSIGGGGAPSSDLAFISSNSGTRATMVSEIVDFVSGNHALNNVRITGIDVDWEFPTTTIAKNNHEALLSELRTALDAQGVIDGVHYELSIAVGGDVLSPTSHADYINPAAFAYPDLVSIMSYDLSYMAQYGGDHASYQAVKDGIAGYMGMGLSASKIMVGLPFYGRTTGGSASPYDAINASASQTIFENSFSGSHHYDGRFEIENKIDYIMDTIGGAGITAWELTQDRTDQYSLLRAGFDYMDANYACAAPQPDLGADLSICGTPSLLLNSQVSTGPGRTFSWKRNGGSIAGSGPTLTVTQDGTYEVEVSEGGCSKTDEVVVSATIPVPNLGADSDICDTVPFVLDANVSGAGLEYEWTKDAATIAGETNQTLNVDEAGTYEVTVSDVTATCSSQSDQITLTSSLINVLDGTRCGSGTVTLTVTDASGPYDWFATPSSSTVLHTGNTYSPSISSNTTYYVHTQGTPTQVNTGPQNFAENWAKTIGANDYQQFTTLTDITLDAISVEAPGWVGSASVNIEIWNQAETVLLGQSGVTNIPPGTQVSVPINLVLSPGTYKAIPVGSNIFIGQGSITVWPFTEPGIITIEQYNETSPGTAGDSYFFEWLVTTNAGSPCARTPVDGIIDVCTGLSEVSEAIEVYPNPANQSITLQNLIGKIDYEIVSSDGGVQLKGNTGGSIDISSLSPGIYVIRSPRMSPVRFVKQ